MTDEERQRAMDFIVEQQARFSVNQQKGDERTSRLERILKLMINAGRRTRRQVRELDEQTRRQVRELDERFEHRFVRLTDALTILTEAQTHTVGRVDALIDIVREGRNGRS